MSMKQTIENKLDQALAPTHLVVKDESHMHNVPEGAESHFNVFVVLIPDGKRLVARHLAATLSSRRSRGRIHASPQDDHLGGVGGARRGAAVPAVS